MDDSTNRDESADVDFASFLAAIRDYEPDASAVRTTAHSSSVTTADWRQIQENLRTAGQ